VTTAVLARWVEHHMTTAVSVAASGVDDEQVGDFFVEVARLEAILSRFRPTSEVSRVARDELHLDDASVEVREVVARCEALRRLTDGDFDHRPGPGQIDLDAVSKGWIVQEAATRLRMDATELLVNAGGDLLGTPRPQGRTWRIGVQHPDDPTALVGTLEVADGAVATSGTYERGEHLRTGGATPLVSVTVTGPDLALADGLSTAAYACGESPPRWWSSIPSEYGLLTIDDRRRVRWLAPLGGSPVTWRPAGTAEQLAPPRQ
jgi:thiamine biosynthesis lipoprotein